MSVVIAGCGSDNVSIPPPVSLDLDFNQRVTMGVPLVDGPSGHLATDGGFISVSIENTGARPLSVQSVHVNADPLLRATYLGYSFCHPGCVGEVPWSKDAAAQAAASLAGTLPLTVETEAHVHQANVNRPYLVFRLEIPTAEGLAALRGGCLEVASVEVAFSDGSRWRVRGFGNRAVMGVFAADHSAPGSAGCAADFPR